MNQEVIQDFLNLPGIAGVALMDRRSRPYFCGVDQTLNFQQKEALAQGILQVVETIPDGFESFKFQFAGHQVHIYKLDHGIILLVLTRSNLVYSDYLKTIKSLKAALREDIANAIATFRLIAGNVTLSGLNYRQQNSTISTEKKSSREVATATDGLTQATPKPPTSPKPVTPWHTEPASPSNGVMVPPPNRAAVPLPEPPAPPVAPVPVSDAQANLSEAIAALNQLSKFTTQYLGTHVIANYWKATRPSHDWLSHFEIDRAAQVSFAQGTSQQLQAPLSLEQQQWLQEWVAAFIKRCSQVIRDFSSIIQQKALTDAQKSLLLG